MLRFFLLLAAAMLLPLSMNATPDHSPGKGSFHQGPQHDFWEGFDPEEHFHPGECHGPFCWGENSDHPGNGNPFGDGFPNSHRWSWNHDWNWNEDWSWEHQDQGSSAPVPEPSSALLMGMGLLGTFYSLKRRRR